ncbi:hypothetical protein [Bacillus thuringiensis]|uniref:hypothetical protein n=2 Tax=Bacillus thuringiensis TaxID=1428 RepID=UPI0038240841
MKGLFVMDFEYHENEIMDDNADTADREYRIEKFVDFCCTIDVPPEFQVLDNAQHRFLYTTNCLDIIIEDTPICCDTKCGPVNGVCHNARIIGCIPYVANIAVTSECGGAITGMACDNADTDDSHIGYICCKGSICVNELIASSTQTINIPKNLDCSLVKLINFGVSGPQTINFCNRSIKCQQRTVVGTIKLPDIPVNHKQC